MDAVCVPARLLSPVTFMENVAVVAMLPAMGNPMCAGVRWALPATGGPDIAASVPAMVSANPNILVSGRRSARFDDIYWGSDSNYDLCERCSREQSYSEQQSWKKLFHDDESSL
jgi:hypothetical protein